MEMTTIRITREEQEDDRERRALGERDRVLGVARDLAGAQRVEPVVDLLADPDLLEPVVVEPQLQAVDVLLGGGLPRRPCSSVTYSSIRSAALRAWSNGDGADRDQERRDDRARRSGRR